MPNETGNPSLIPSILESSLPDPFVSTNIIIMIYIIIINNLF